MAIEYYFLMSAYKKMAVYLNELLKKDNNIKFLILMMALNSTLTNMIGNNVDELSRTTFLLAVEPFLVLLAIAAILYLILLIAKITTKKSINLIFIVFIFYIYAFFNFKLIIEIGLYFTNRKVLLFCYLLAINFTIITVSIRYYQNKSFVKFVKIFVSVFFLISTFNMIYNILSIEKFNIASTKIEYNSSPNYNTNSSPNIYFIIADGLTGPSNYKRLTKDNYDIIGKFAEEYKFKIIKNSKSNYLGSASSIGSIFHLNYFRNENSNFETPSPTSYYPAVFFNNNSYTLSTLINKGYKIHFSGSWYTYCRGPEIKCIEKNYFTLNRLSLRIFSNSFFNYLSPGWFGKNFPSILRRDVDAISPLIKTLEKKGFNQSNNFYFIHHMQPHDPWYFDNKCNHISVSTKDVSELYRDSVHCLIKQTSILIDVIDNNDPNSIIVLSGDHGWLLPDDALGVTEDMWDKELLFYRSEITNLIRFPQNCQKWIQDSIGPLNTMRFILGCISNEKPEYLTEYLFIPSSDYNKNGRLIKLKQNNLDPMFDN